MNYHRAKYPERQALLILVKYFDPTRSEDLHCHDCGWQGALRASALNKQQGSRDYRCPCCSSMLAMVSDADKVQINSLQAVS